MIAMCYDATTLYAF